MLVTGTNAIPVGNAVLWYVLESESRNHQCAYHAEPEWRCIYNQCAHYALFTGTDESSTHHTDCAHQQTPCIMLR